MFQIIFDTLCKLREILLWLQLMYHVPGWYLFLVEKPKFKKKPSLSPLMSV